MPLRKVFLEHLDEVAIDIDHHALFHGRVPKNLTQSSALAAAKVAPETMPLCIGIQSAKVYLPAAANKDCLGIGVC